MEHKIFAQCELHATALDCNAGQYQVDVDLDIFSQTIVA